MLYNVWNDSDSEDGHPPRKRPRMNARIAYNEPNDFRERFRLTPSLFEKLHQEVGAFLTPEAPSNNSMNSRQKLLVALRFYATGQFYYSIADAEGCHKSTVCRAVKEVTLLLLDKLRHYVLWPNDAVELRNTQRRFYRMSNHRLWGICGALDGTHVNIRTPNENEHHYVNRHHRHSLNVLAACGTNYEFFFISSRWPGSVGDARVLRNSSLYRDFQNGFRPFPNAVLIADATFPALPWLIPMRPHAPNQEYYNDLAKARRIIENSFGLLKERFRCIKESELRVQSPEYAAVIVQVVCFLHNFIIKRREEYENDDANYINP